MTVSEELPAPKRSRLSLKGVRKYPPKPTLDEASLLNDDLATSSLNMNTEFPEPRTPDQPIVIPESPIKMCSPEKRSEKPVIAAFNNLGNTCFLNSVLQILRYTPGFVTRLNVLCRELLLVYKQQRAMAEDGETVEASAPWRLVRCLQKLYVKMDRVENEFEEDTDDCDLVVQPEKLLDTIRELNPMYEGNFQHDAQELLHCILCFTKDAVQELVEFHDSHPTTYRPVTVATSEASLTSSHVSLAAGNAASASSSTSDPTAGLATSCNESVATSCENDVVATEVKLARDSLSSLSDAIGDVVIDDATVENVVVFDSDVTDYDAPTQPFDDVTNLDPNLNSIVRDEDELPPPPGGFPTADELFGDESMDSPVKEGRMETVAMETGPVAKDRINDTIDRVLRGETTVDWTRDWVQDNDEGEFTYNFDNPSDALCEENRAIAESLKDAAAMASVASAISDGKLTPRSTQTPKTSPIKSTVQSEPSPSTSAAGSPTTSVVVEVCSQSSLPPGTLRRASTSSSAIKVQDAIEVLEEAEEKPVVHEVQDCVFAQPLSMRGGARRETKITAKRSKPSPPGAKVRKPRKPALSRGLSVCNGDVNTELSASPSKLMDEIPNGFHGKENIPMPRNDKEIFPVTKTYSRKRTQNKEQLPSPVRRSPRKLNQKKEELEAQGTKLQFDPIEVKINGEVQTWEIEMPSPTESLKSGPAEPAPIVVETDESSSRKRVLSSPSSDNAEPRAKRHSTDECPPEEWEPVKQEQPTIPALFGKRTVVRRLGMHGATSRKSKSPEKNIDLTQLSQQSSNDVNVSSNDVTDDVIDDEDVGAHAQESVEMEEDIESESEAPSTPNLKRSAMDNAQTMRVRLEKCNLKEKYPDLKVSTTPPKQQQTFDPEPCKLVENLFEGRVALRTRCMECEGSSDRVESFQDVSVPVKRQQGGVACDEKREELSDDEESASPPPAAHWMLKELSEVEHLRDENKYFCEACHQLVEAERSTHYDVMPSILTLHLKRFAATAGFFGGLSKITDHVTIPLTLPCFGANCEQPCPSHRYELYGLIMHSGVTITSGHYVSYVRLNYDVITSRDDVIDDRDVTDSRLLPKWSLEGRWIECDDDQVKVLSESDFDHVLSESNFGTPYVLFYNLCHL